jgi:hypothetical protein
LIFELFFPVRDDFFERIARSVPRFSVEITLESHKQELRRINGKLPCSNELIEETIRRALDKGVGRVDLFFMVGLPRQSYEDAVGCVDYCRSLLEKFSTDSRLWFFVAPLRPSWTGQSAFEQPERFGYRKFCHTLEDHRRALTAPTWKQVLNYETDCMTRDQIVAATTMLRHGWRSSNRSRLYHGSSMHETLDRIRASRAVIAEVDAILTLPDGAARDAQLSDARERHRTLQPQTTCAKEELQWPSARRFGRLPRLLWLAARLLAREAYVLAFKRARLAAYHGLSR